MKQEYVVQNRLGLHVKPSKQIAMAAAEFECEIQLSLGDRSINGKIMIEILKLGAKFGDKVVLTTSGPGAQDAQQIVGALLSQGIESSGNASK
jgi:phosphotransferase system HPr (HPr) family protein